MNDHDPAIEDLVDPATPDSAPPFGDVCARRGRRRTDAARASWRRRRGSGRRPSLPVADGCSMRRGADRPIDPAPAPTVL